METRTEKDMPVTSVLSPTKGYISHVPASQPPPPPPPYALHQNSQPVGGYSISGLISPPASHSTESRRPSDEPNDYHQSHQRQSLPSLPSISEALHYPPRTVAGPPPPPPAAQQPPHSYGNPSSFSNPPQPPPPRAYPSYEERAPYPPSHNHHMRRSPPAPPSQAAPSYASTSHYPPPSSERNQSLPSLRTALPSQAAPFSPHHHQEPSRYESDPRRMEPPREEPSRVPRAYNDPYYGYPTPGGNAYPGPYPPRPRSPGYPSSAPYSRPEPPRYGREDMGRPMGVKRDFEHGEPEPSMMFQRQLEANLGNHDFEMALGELQQCGMNVSKISEDILEAVRRYQREPDSQGMPAMRYHDQMLGCQRKLEEAFSNIKDFMAQQQRQLDLHHDMKAKSGRGDGYGDDEHWGAMDKDQNFNGPDQKKIRRGQRAAPPGRCHSCNRAETPEWRRGPDGARTLCNACGLHYAKLTRRMGSKNAPNAAGSALRPKSIDGSPM